MFTLITKLDPNWVYKEDVCMSTLEFNVYLKKCLTVVPSTSPSRSTAIFRQPVCAKHPYHRRIRYDYDKSTNNTTNYIYHYLQFNVFLWGKKCITSFSMDKSPCFCVYLNIIHSSLLFKVFMLSGNHLQLTF